jgi:cyclophilin family peptidyl-prolyl cis-trans isomerase
MSRSVGTVAIAALFAGVVCAAEAPVRRATTPQTVPAPQAALGPAEAVVETDAGWFVVKLLHETAPGHVSHFVKTAKAGGFDRTTFHRIIPGGIVQGGDPLSKDPTKAAQYGTGGLGLLKAEPSDRAFTRGTVAAVRRPSSLDSAGNQFFICLSDQSGLKGQYTIFGEVISGMEVVDKIGLVPVDGDRAKERLEIKSVTIRAPASEPPAAR